MGAGSSLQHVVCNRRTARTRIAARGVALVIALAGAAGDAAAQTRSGIGSPLFIGSFQEIQSDGNGGTLPDPYLGGGFNALLGGQDDFFRAYQLPPPPPITSSITHLAAYSNARATTFWAEAISPGTGLFPAREVAVGGTLDFAIYQSFIKDDADASLSFTITDLEIRAFELSGPENEGLTGIVSFETMIYDGYTNSGPSVLDLFTNRTSLTGRGGEWSLENSGPLAVDYIDNTGEATALAAVALQGSYTRSLDLSAIPVGTEFYLQYRMTVTAIDTVQFDSRMNAYGRDPLDPDSGTFFTFNGLTPTNNPLVAPQVVPEPGSLLLLAVGLAAVGSRRLARPRGGPY